MHHRSRYRLSFPPFAIVTACAAALAAIWFGPLGDWLGHQPDFLLLAIVGICTLLPAAFSAWYLFSYADLRGTRLTVRSMLSARRIELRELVAAEVYAKPSPTVMDFLMGQGGFGVSKHARRHDLMLLLTDESGAQALLPLNSWRSEDLLMARVLRATVERRVRIAGEPLLVRRFSGLLDTYRSWDRQQAAA